MRRSLVNWTACLSIALVAACDDPPSAPVVTISPTTPTTLDELKAQIVTPSVDPNGKPTTYSYLWLLNGVPQTDLTGDTVPADRTGKKQTWSVIVTPSDGVLDGPTATAEVMIGNLPPSVTISFEPAAPVRGQPLKVVATATDLDEDRVTFSYAWLRQGQVTNFAGDLVPGDELGRGEVWQVTVTPNDGTENGAPEHASVIVGNSKPVVASVALLPAVPTREAHVTAVADGVSDEDGDEVQLRYEWTVDGNLVDGVTGAVLATTYFKKEQLIAVKVTTNDGTDDGQSATASATSVNSPPSAPMLTISSRPGDTQDIVCTVSKPSVDADGDPLTYTVSWSHDGQSVPGIEPVDDRTTKVPAAISAEGGIYACFMAATDGTDYTPALEAATAKVNIRPVLSTVTLLPKSPTQDLPVYVQIGNTVDLDQDPVEVRFTWKVNGATVLNETGTSLSNSHYARGDVVTVVATPNDGIEDGVAISDGVVVANTPPTVPGVVLTPVLPGLDDPIQCAVAPPSIDIDFADVITYEFVWKRTRADGQEVPLPAEAIEKSDTASVVKAGYTEDGDTFECVVKVSDGSVVVPAPARSVTVHEECLAVFEKASFADAKVDCEARNGHLVWIESPKVNQQVEQLCSAQATAASGASCWIGLRDPWTTWLGPGSPAVTYRNWWQQPVSGQDAECTRMYSDHMLMGYPAGAWDDLDCLLSAEYVCRFDCTYGDMSGALQSRALVP